MKSVLPTLLLLAVPTALQAQEDKAETDLVIQLRFSDISGDVDTSFGLDYGDLWGTGVGLTVETDFMFPLKKNWAIGMYVSGGFDIFGGDSFTDDASDTLEADDLITSQILLGFKANLAPDKGFFFDARIGIGVVFWGDTEGVLTVAGTPFDVVIFEQTAAFAFEIGTHIGYSTRQLFIAAGFALRTVGAPDSPDFAFEGTSTALVASFELEFGFRF